MRRLRILFVAMANSVHTARWVGQLAGLGWDVRLFPVQDADLHPELRDVKVYHPFQYPPRDLPPGVELLGAWPLPRALDLGRRLVGKLVPGTRADRATRLANAIRDFRPDIVHSLEIQHAGYLTLAARERLGGRFSTWVVTNWGSDIFVFGRLRGHREKIAAVLAACDYYDCECHRDVALARAFGLRKPCLPVLPNTGGFDLERVRALRQEGPTSARRGIALKGYQTWAGRALTGLRALELSREALGGYRVEIYSADPDVALCAELLAERTGLAVEVLPRSPHAEVLRLHGRARISIGLSIGDAISTSALEAMVMGSFPIQSHTSCLDEWVEDGVSGMLVHPEDPEQVAEAVRRALADDALVDRAAEINARVAAERLDRSAIRAEVIASYERIAARSPSRAESRSLAQGVLATGSARSSTDPTKG